MNCESAAPSPTPSPSPAPDPKPDPKPEPKPDPAPDRADLAVTVKAPRKAVSGPATFTIVVKNNGPDAVAYTLKLVLTSQRRPVPRSTGLGSVAQTKLGKGDSRSKTVEAMCQKTGGGAKARVTASVSFKGNDPVSTNDSSTGQARLR